MGEVVTPFKKSPEAQKIEPPERLLDTHDLADFDCGNPDLNDWLKARAQKADGKTARTYVAASGGVVVAYYCLAAGAVIRKELPSAKIRQNAPEQVPVVVIGRVAVAKDYQGKGLGHALLKDAILRAIATSEAIGVRAIVIHALDERGVKFYKAFGFLESPLDARTLILPIETAKAALP